MDLFLYELGEYIRGGNNIDEITKKISKYIKKKDILLKIFPTEIVNLIRSFIHDPYLIPTTKMLFLDYIDYPALNTKDENNKILETMCRLLVNDYITFGDEMIKTFFIDYVNLQTRDINITKKLLERYKYSFFFDECFDFSNIKTSEEMQLFEQYRNMLGYCYYYRGKFPWEYPIGTFI